jgi:1,4-dihydroxy-2-naphthoate polyprenyltransferase
VVPVAVGTACAGVDGAIVWWRAIAALVVSLALQVGVNYANDYSDGVRGTDSDRVGPLRLVGSGAASAKAVKVAAYSAFGVAAVAGLALAAVTTWWLIAVGVVAILAAWTYTGGPRPYGYAGFGELFVFVFFGLVATVGSEFVHQEQFSALGWILSVGVGLLAMALLVVNNLRDIPGDTAAGKRTLAVRIGDGRTRMLYLVCLVGALLSSIVGALSTDRLAVLLGLGAAAIAVGPVRAVQRGALGRALIPVLGATGKVQLAFGVLTTVGIAIASR